MKVLGARAGVGLIELIIVLAIAAALIPIVFAGQRALRARSQFTDAIDKVKNNLVQIKNEANTTVNSEGAGSVIGRQVIGKLATFTSGGSTYTVTTITLDRSANVNNNALLSTAPVTVTIPWSVTNTTTGLACTPTPCATAVLFARNPDTGELKAYTTGSGCAATDLLDLSKLGSLCQNKADFAFTDPDGRVGHVFVDASSTGAKDGDITRVIQ